ncbi:MAG TPA: STAS domain-containing protein [Acidobacteriaceae bacterium]|nr:STAS domain-containing protein [Acidobacteriaceae bacterium]
MHTALNATGLHALEVFAERLRTSGRTLLLCGARDQLAEMISRADFVEEVGQKNILPHVQAALHRAREIGGDFDAVGAEIARDMELMKV